MSTRRTFLGHAMAASFMAGLGSRMARAANTAASARPATMKMQSVPGTDLTVSRIAYGCAGLAKWDKGSVDAEELSRAASLVHTAYENGITLFDHADVYAFGKAETVFGKVLKQSPGLREKILIQSKCGQGMPDWSTRKPIRVNSSSEYIVNAAEGILRRLDTDRLDILLLHAPDALMEPEDVAQGFDSLHRAGKVRYFGVSNFSAAQIQLLKQAVKQPVVVNQIRVGLLYPAPLAQGLEFTAQLSKGLSSDGSFTGLGNLIDYCRLSGIQVQAWSPVAGLFNIKPDAKAELKALVKTLEEIAAKRGVSPGVIALAWLLRHPAGIVPVTGSNNPANIVENCSADRIELSRDEWYDLFAAATALQSSTS